MSQTKFDAKYPTLCKILEGSSFDADKTTASEKPLSEFKDALQHARFSFNDLLGLLCGALIPEWNEVDGDRLESGLAKIVGAIGLAKTKSAYYDKLLVRDQKALQDVCYEVAVTAIVCDVFDSGTLDLEKSIPNAQPNRGLKNSDIFGTVQGQPVRIEVTVLHEKALESVDLDLVEILEGAKTEAGYEITMRSALKDDLSAQQARALLEKLDAHHAASGGASVEIDGIRFDWVAGGYTCGHGTSPFERIRFFGVGDLRGGKNTRDIRHPVSTRLVTPLYLKEDHPNPPGVVDFTDLPDAPTQAPVSTKIRQMLDKKLAQCEAGGINIIAFGNPSHRHESDLGYALRGAPIAVVPFTTDENGTRRMGDGQLYRAPKAPFNPADKLASDEDRETFIEPFRPMSAVLHIRLGNDPLYDLIENPNAHFPLPSALAEAILSAAKKG